MEQEVYVDLLFIINLSMDYLCLYICAKVMKRKVSAVKLLISSSLGALYSVLSLFLPIGSFVALIFDAAVCFLICSLAFHEKQRGLSSTMLCSFLFVGISMMTGGCMTAIFNLLNRINFPLDEIDGDSISTYLFASAAAIAGIIALRSGQAISRHASVTSCHLTVKVGSNSLSVNALADSGNLVRDPISGKQIILIDKEAFSSLGDASVYDMFISGQTCSDGIIPPRGLRLIPINTASGHGILAASIPDEILVSYIDKKGKTKTFSADALISPTRLYKNSDGYKAIVPTDLIK